MTLIDLYCVVEGQTEESFARKVLGPHLVHFGVTLVVELIGIRSRVGRPGGIREYQKLKRDLQILVSKYQSPRARFTTMIDLYGLRELKDEFPGMDTLPLEAGPRLKVLHLQKEMKTALGDDDRILPYLQLHEFEALILSAPKELKRIFPESQAGVQDLLESITGLDPEDINSEDPPSKRIEHYIPEYARQKLRAVRAAEAIGLAELRMKCPHFGDWLTSLENLGQG